MAKEKSSFIKDYIIFTLCIVVTAFLYLSKYKMLFYSLKRTYAFAFIIYLGVTIIKYFLIKRFNRNDFKLFSFITGLGTVLYKVDIDTSYSIILMLYFSISILYYLSIDSQKNNIKGKIIISFIILLVVSINFYENSTKAIKDWKIEERINEKLDGYAYKGKMNESNLKKISYLNLHTKSHYNLEGIENLKNLDRLIIDGINIKNIYNISLLKNLRYLRTENINLSDLRKLKTMDSLEILDISYLNVDTEKSIENFPNLKKLEIQGLTLDDLSIFKELKSIESLRISFCKLKSLDGIENFRNLKEINFLGVEIKNYNALKNIKANRKIYYKGQEVTNIKKILNKSSYSLKVINDSFKIMR
ncbi:MAG: hypothetical protein FH751_15255 [Firmicutes bacterium]|nr:hypothetical protein [Bacillota bacterium]